MRRIPPLYAQPTISSASLIGSWQFNATATTPSASMDGFVDVLFDSAGYVAGGLRIGKKVERFHGRHLTNRFLIRTDTSAKPTIRIDATLDSSVTSMSGNLQVSTVDAKEAGKKMKKYENVMFAFFGTKASGIAGIKRSKRTRARH